MKNIKYLHIMHNEKFIVQYIEFINKNFKKDENFFLIIGGFSKKEILWKKYDNTLYLEEKKEKNKILKIWKILKRILMMNKVCKVSTKIYFHSLFSKDRILFLFIFRKYFRNSNWIIWGGDLYCYNERKKGILENIYYKIENYVKGNFKGYITLMKGEYRLTQKWYGARGKFLKSFTYPSNLYKEIVLTNQAKEYLVIQVGNSATFSNNHFEIFEKLKKHKNKNIRIYCPLSYGDKEYAKKVIERGNELFGEKFIPMTEFLEYSKYLEFLSSIDIAIFAHDRQQAFGNITSLLSMKKTIYIKETISTYETLIELGINVKSFDKFDDLEIFDIELLEDNKNIIKENFSEKILKEQWENIFKN